MFFCKKHNLVYEPTQTQMKEVMQKSAVLKVFCPTALCESSGVVHKGRFSTKWLDSQQPDPPVTRSVRGQLKKCDYNKKNSK